MENLKTTITKTDKLKNDLKLAKENINDIILSGGGTRANTISEVPNKIDEMLGQYRKVAILELGETSKYKHEVGGNSNDGKTKTFTVAKLNIDFIPSKVYIHMEMNSSYGGKQNNSLGLCEKDKRYKASCSAGSSDYNFKLQNKDLILTSLITQTNYHCDFTFKVFKVIAIE